MNNQITVVNSQEQQAFVDCICYFLNTKTNKINELNSSKLKCIMEFSAFATAA